MDHKLYFGAFAETSGAELWSSDGTVAGTELVVDLWPEGDSLPLILGVLGDAILLSASTGGSRDLWRVDSDGEATRLAEGISPLHLTTLDDKILFVGDDDNHGRELWVTDGSSDGTHLVKDINHGTMGTEIRLLGVLGNSVYFSAFDGGDNPHGREVWKSDGTEDGTVLVRDIHPGIGNSFNSGSFPNRTVVWNDSIYFVTTDRSSSGEGEVWRTDGTEEGTVRITDPSFVHVGGPRAQLTVVSETLYFFGEVDEIDYLFSSDGTLQGTKRVLAVPGLTSLTADGSSAFMLSRNASLWAWENHTTEVQVPDGGGTIRVATKDNRAIVRHNDVVLLESTLRDIGRNRRFTFSGTGNDITFGGAGDTFDNRSRIDVGNTEIDFVNPAALLLIDAGDGDDHISFIAPDRGLNARIEVARAFQDDGNDFV